jgi:crotonobetainyl-CoA:carnitine CoA-transferase CaiB-like acyl-CoA transferase
MTGAPQGNRILDMSRIPAGAWATQILGDYGADIVKVERPGSGDLTRGWGLDAESLRRRNPRLIYCTISAFGSDSSRAE